MYWVLIAVALWAISSTIGNVWLGSVLSRKTRFIEFMEERLLFFEKNHRETVKIRQSVRALNEDRRQLTECLKNSRAENSWTKNVLIHYGLGHILARDPDSPLWETTDTPKPPVKR